MYYCIGWPRISRLPQKDPGTPVKVSCNRDRILVAVLTTDSVIIWYNKPCVPIISHRRCPSSVSELGENKLIVWKPDSSMIAVATASGHIIFYNIVVYTEVKSLYEQEDPSNPALRRESAELYFKENVPPLIFSQAFEICVPGGVTDIVTIRDELMISTNDGHILRYMWDGQMNRDYCLDLRRIPFCTDQQVLRAVPLVDEGYVREMSYSPLLGGFTVVLSDGRAAFLVAGTLKFDPNSVQGIWAGGVEDITCTAPNHKFRLMAFGRENSQGIVYSIDETTGGLEISHKLILPTKDYPGCPGPVTGLRWTPDGMCLALVWAAGGFSVWSTFGTMILCSFGWDHGNNITDPIKQAPYNILDMDWSGEGYQLWVVNSSKRRFTGTKDAEFCPFPKEGDEEDKEEPSQLGDNVLVIPFVKSPLSVNPAMSSLDKLYLQGEDRLYLNSTENVSSVAPTEDEEIAPVNPQASASKQWTIVIIPHAYISSSWPIRYTAMNDSGSHLAVAGRTGLAHYSTSSRKWKLFGNETQEKEFVVTGGLLWWKEFLVIGCYNLINNRDEVRIYPRESRLDNSYASSETVDAQVLLINKLEDRLVVYCANSHISLFDIYTETSNPLMCRLRKVQDVDASLLSIHPACVVSVSLSHLKTESVRQRKESERESVERELRNDTASLILNVSGKLVLVQRERTNNNELLYSAPTVLAGQCEQVWLPRQACMNKPHLTLSLWLYCGAAGMKVWLPLFPKDDESQHSFMARRIMLHFPLENIYPLAIHFQEAIIVGVENDSALYPGDKTGPAILPFNTLERVSQVYLHQLLRQLIRRNLGHHAWDIARSCIELPYFQHSLELLLHSVLEEEATSKAPIPDALLPSIVDFIRSFPVYRETVVRCTRKTEVALWPYLFAAVGSAKELFNECLEKGELNTAASYLIILQSLEPALAAKQHATLLFDAALDHGAWDLSKDLVRFLRAIDPDECGEIASPRSVSKPSFPSPLSPTQAGEEDLSLVLGTLVVPRSRSISTTTPGPKPASPPDHQALSRSVSEKQQRLRKASSSSSPNTSKDGGTAEEFFIDIILARHARKLLMAGRLTDLGIFSARLDFYLVSWLRREAPRAAQLEDYVWALNQIHKDFEWPWPTSWSRTGSECRSRTSSHLSVGGYSHNSDPPTMQTGAYSNTDKPSLNITGQHESTTLIEDKLKSLYVECGDRTGTESGYMSTSTGRQVSEQSLLSEQAVDAMLRVRDRTEQLSVLSEDGDVRSICDETPTSPTILDTPPLPPELSASDSPPRREVQLRYMLQLLVEAGCLEWAAAVSVVLRDAMAIIRIVNAARSSQDAAKIVGRLHDGFNQLDAYAQQAGSGYRTFLNSIQPQIRSLSKFINATPLTFSDPPLSASSLSGSPPLRPSLPRTLSDPQARRSKTPPRLSPSPPGSPSLAESFSEAEEDPSACSIS